MSGLLDLVCKQAAAGWMLSRLTLKVHFSSDSNVMFLVGQVFQGIKKRGIFLFTFCGICILLGI